ncbi:MAG: alpha/beta fold hydrolase [Anaerolineae bacterium]|nr:alpha/beta fold hydrolase [Anaerolineae bacterium]
MKIYPIQWLLLTILFTGCSGSTPAALATPGPLASQTNSPTFTAAVSPTPIPSVTASPTPWPWSTEPHPLQIEVMRQQSYPGGPINIERNLAPGSNYNQYVVSYPSDGYKIYALMTVPNGVRPETGWPVIIFNHGYIPPAEYRTTERYVAYVDMFARNGYLVFKPDYRGFGSSEGGEVAGGGYGTPAYTVDILNALASLKTYADADPDRIGMWGHSMGGQITLRAMVVSPDIKAGVIWAGVVTDYANIVNRWDSAGRATQTPSPAAQTSGRSWRREFGSWVEEFSLKYGDPDQNPQFWASISPNSYLAELSGPLKLHHSTTDETVPIAWSETLAAELQASRQYYQYYVYPDDNHNINANFGTAMQRTLDFFDQYVKNL